MSNYKQNLVLMNTQSGFGLLEVMTSMVLFAIGILGLASLQITGLMNNQSAYQNSQATIMAYDIADRMRANDSGLAAYLTENMTLDEAEEAGAVTACKTTTGCTSAEQAQNDLVEWSTDLKGALPEATGTISVVDRMFTVTVAWDDNRDGAVDTSDASFQMSFRP